MTTRAGSPARVPAESAAIANRQISSNASA
jgi:hypothetical protein